MLQLKAHFLFIPWTLFTHNLYKMMWRQSIKTSQAWQLAWQSQYTQNSPVPFLISSGKTPLMLSLVQERLDMPNVTSAAHVWYLSEMAACRQTFGGSSGMDFTKLAVLPVPFATTFLPSTQSSVNMLVPLETSSFCRMTFCVLPSF